MAFILWVLLLAALGILLVLPACLRQPKNPGRCRSSGNRSARTRFPPKPAWVKKEVIRLKALMPHHGCRAISMVFNQLWEVRRGMTIGKTFVAEVIRAISSASGASSSTGNPGRFHAI